jgi:putative transposase
VELRFIQSGKPGQNACIESFNSRFRRMCRVVDNWRDGYNHHQPHSSPGYLPPATFAAQCRQRAGGTAQ